MNITAGLDDISQKMREKYQEAQRIVSNSYEEKKSIQYKARAKLLEELLQELAYIRKDYSRKAADVSKSSKV